MHLKYTAAASYHIFVAIFLFRTWDDKEIAFKLFKT
jgi:hypothetical protein